MNETPSSSTTLFLRPAFGISAKPGTGLLAVVVRAEDRPLQVPAPQQPN